jgi:hypothetical protein
LLHLEVGAVDRLRPGAILQAREHEEVPEVSMGTYPQVLSGIHPGYSGKEGRKVEDGLLLEFPCTPTRTRSV